MALFTLKEILAAHQVNRFANTVWPKPFIGLLDEQANYHIKIISTMPNPIIEENKHEMTFLAIRRAIGFIGILFPAILWLGVTFIGKCEGPEESVSAYYFTIMGDVFVGLLVAIGLFLYAYKGHSNRENWLTNLAGLLAVIVAFFPTNSNADGCLFIDLDPIGIRQTIHFSAAVGFFVLLAIISIFVFPKSKEPGGELLLPNLNRNPIYYSCGAIIIVALVLIWKFMGSKDWPNATFWLEWVALLAFGISWLTKGRVSELITNLRKKQAAKGAQA